MSDFAIAIISTFFGWVLGVITGPIYDHIKDANAFNDFKKSLKVELNYFGYLLTLNCFMTNKSLGLLDLDFVNWFLQTIEKFEGPTQERDQMIVVARQILNANLNDLNQLNQNFRQQDAGKTKSIPPLGLKLIHECNKHIHKFDKETQQIISKLNGDIDTINFKVSEVAKYDVMTFDSSLTTENHQSVVSNSEINLKMAAEKSKQAVDGILKLNEKI